MAGNFTLEVVTPERKLLSEEVDAVYAPGDTGEFGVLPQHALLLSALKMGELRYHQGSEVKKVAIIGGFAEVDQTHMRVLAETAEYADEIDVERAEAAKGRAEKRLDEIDRTEKPDDFKRAELALQRALIRLKVAGKG